MIGCDGGGAQATVRGFNPLELIFTPAYAQEFNCMIVYADGTVAQLGQKTYEECKDAIIAYFNGLPEEERQTKLYSAGMALGLGLSGGIAAEEWLSANALTGSLSEMNGTDDEQFSLGYLNGTNVQVESIRQLGAIWSNDTLSVQEKFAAVETAGVDLTAVVAMAMLGIGAKSLVKPAGIPDAWIIKPANKGGGTRYTNPDNPQDFVRVMPGTPKVQTRHNRYHT